MIVKLATRCLKEKLCPKNKINDKIATDLEGFITRQYIGQILGKDYKDQSHIHRGKNKAEEKVSEDKLMVQIGEAAIETTESELKDEANRVSRESEMIASQDFHDELNQALDQRAVDVKEINSAALKELDTLSEKLKEQDRVIKYLREELNFKSMILSTFERFVGKYIKYNNEFEIIDVKED